MRPMTYSNKFKYTLKGLELKSKGYQRGLPFRFKALSSTLAGFEYGRNDLVFGDTGGGKSSLVLDMYIMHLFDYCYNYNITHKQKSLDLKILYFALKDDEDIIYTKCIAWFLKKYLNISVSIDHLRSKNGDKVHPSLLAFINTSSEFKHYFEAFNSTVKIITRELSAQDIKNELELFAKEQGNIKIGSNYVNFVPDNPHQMNLVVFDAIEDIKPENGFKRFDILSEQHEHIANCKSVYNAVYKFHTVNICSSDTKQVQQRAKFGNIQPELSDISNTALLNNADIVLSLFKPITYANYSDKAKNWQGYPVYALKDKFRMLTVLKNTYGPANKSKALKYEGACNWFSEMPIPNKIKEEDLEKLKSFTPVNWTWSKTKKDQFLNKAINHFNQKNIIKENVTNTESENQSNSQGS